jgi:sensor histidine kinase YesM
MEAPRGTRHARRDPYSSQLEQQIKNMNEQRDADRERIKQLEQSQRDMEASQKSMQDMFAKFMLSQQSASGG